MRTEERERAITESGHGGKHPTLEIDLHPQRWPLDRESGPSGTGTGGKSDPALLLVPSVTAREHAIHQLPDERQRASRMVCDVGEAMEKLTVGRIDGGRIDGLAAVNPVGSLIEESFAYRRC